MPKLEKIIRTLKAYRLARVGIKRQYDRSAIEKVRDEKLRRLVQYCYENIKYYKEAFEHSGICIDKIRGAEDICKLDFITKTQLRERLWDFFPKEISSCRISRTSGSTGVPVCIFSDVNSRVHNAAAVLRYRKAVGIRFCGMDIVTPLKNEGEKTRKPIWTYFHGAHKTYYVNPYLDDKKHFYYISKVTGRGKKFALIGITPAIVKLAHMVIDGKVDRFRPEAIITGGQSLSEKDRELIEETFGRKVTDVYSCSEAGEVAWQCGQSDYYHINEDECVVEILKDGKEAKAGEIGEVVVTNLNRFAMPILRYKTGDMAIATDQWCRCGRKLRMIVSIIGRNGDDIVCPDGKVLLWNQLKGFMNIADVRQFQIVQKADGNLVVKYVRQPGADVVGIDRLIRKRIEPVVGDSIEMETKVVDAILPGKSGKIKVVVSDYKK